jgi:hypothetical protein
MIVKRREAGTVSLRETECCSAARWDAQNITKLDQDQELSFLELPKAGWEPAFRRALGPDRCD